MSCHSTSGWLSMVRPWRGQGTAETRTKNCTTLPVTSRGLGRTLTSPWTHRGKAVRDHYKKAVKKTFNELQ